jgi:hypothetical protein
MKTTPDFSQAEFCNLVIPMLRTQGVFFKKKKTVLARRATPGEQVATVTADGLETTNQAQEGDYLLQNQTLAREQYLLSEKKFEKKYEQVATHDDGWNEYQTTDHICAVEVTDDFLQALDLPAEWHFEAAWGEPMVAKKGDFLASPADLSEVYRIARQEFFETYSEVRE